MLTERQKTAQAIAAELHKLGAWVVSPMPLADNQALRWQVLDSDREAILEKVSSWGWSAALKCCVPRFTARGPLPSSVYENDLPRPRQPVVDTRTIRGEVAEHKKSAEELEAMRKHLGLR